jgi:Ran GTPase-activating protein (RanGAP) involved in mRNA processing and transport
MNPLAFSPSHLTPVKCTSVNTNMPNDNSSSNSSISPAVRELCDWLRANDPRVLDHDSFCVPFNKYKGKYSEGERIEVFQALKESTSVKRIRISPNQFTQSSAEAAAEYMKSSKNLQAIDLHSDPYTQVSPAVMSLLLRALSRSTSVTALAVETKYIRLASVAFQELLTCTQTLQKLEMSSEYQDIDEVQLAAITSGFANNTTLRDLRIESWRSANLVPVLTALQDHPALRRIRLVSVFYACLESVSGLEVLLRSHDSKVKELVLEQVDAGTVGLYSVMRELAHNTTVTSLAIRKSVLSRENVQQLKWILRQNTALESLDLTGSALGSVGLVEIAPVLYRNTSIKSLALSNNGLDDIESANVLRELIRRNKTITSLSMALNAFGRNAAAVRSIADGVRSNTTLQQLDFGSCRLDDQGISVLANALAIRNASLLELNLRGNRITFGGRSCTG